MTKITGFEGLDNVHKVTQIRCQAWYSDITPRNITPRKCLRCLLHRYKQNNADFTILSMNTLPSSLNIHVYKDLLPHELRLRLPQSLNTGIYPSYKNGSKVLGNVKGGILK